MITREDLQNGRATVDQVRSQEPQHCEKCNIIYQAESCPMCALLDVVKMFHQRAERFCNPGTADLGLYLGGNEFVFDYYRDLRPFVQDHKRCNKHGYIYYGDGCPFCQIETKRGE